MLSILSKEIIKEKTAVVIGIFGDNCVGKTTVANEIKEDINATVYCGKDYLKLAKSENMAEIAFKKLLKECEEGDKNAIYVISEKDQLKFLPEKAKRVLVVASLETTKTRFAKRMGGNLPKPVELMLERKHGMFETEPHDLRIDTDKTDKTTYKTSLLSLLNA